MNNPRHVMVLTLRVCHAFAAPISVSKNQRLNQLKGNSHGNNHGNISLRIVGVPIHSRTIRRVKSSISKRGS